MSKINNTSVGEAIDIKAKLKPLEDNLSKVAGIPVELTLRGERTNSYTISFDGDNPEAQSKLKSYLGDGVKWNDCGYDEGSEATFMYFNVMAGDVNESAGQGGFSDNVYNHKYIQSYTDKFGYINNTNRTHENDAALEKLMDDMGYTTEQKAALLISPGRHVAETIDMRGGVTDETKNALTKFLKTYDADDFNISEAAGDNGYGSIQDFVTALVYREIPSEKYDNIYAEVEQKFGRAALLNSIGSMQGGINISNAVNYTNYCNQEGNLNESVEDDTALSSDLLALFKQSGYVELGIQRKMKVKDLSSGKFIDIPSATNATNAEIDKILAKYNYKRQPHGTQAVNSNTTTFKLIPLNESKVNEGVDGMTDKQEKEIADEYRTIQYDYTMEDAIEHLADKHTYGSQHTIVKALKSQGVELTYLKNGKRVDAYPNIKADSVKEELTQAEYVRIRKEPMARLYEFNSIKKMFILKAGKKPESNIIGSISMQEGKRYMVNMYGVAQLCTYKGKINEIHMFAPVSNQSVELTGTTDEFIRNIRPVKESYYVVLQCDDGSAQDGNVIGKAFNSPESYDESGWRDEHDGWTIIYLGNDKKKAESFGIQINESTVLEEPAEIYIDGYPYYLSKMGDTTHFEMVNDKNACGTGGICVHHVGEYRDHPMYDDLTKWLKGGDSMNGKKYGEIKEAMSHGNPQSIDDIKTWDDLTMFTGISNEEESELMNAVESCGTVDELIDWIINNISDKDAQCKLMDYYTKYWGINESLKHERSRKINEQDEVWTIDDFKSHLGDEAGNYHMAYPEDKQDFLQWLGDNAAKLPYSINRFQSVIGGNNSWHTANDGDVDVMINAVGNYVNENKKRGVAMMINENKVSEESQEEPTMADAVKKARSIIASGTTAWEDVKTELAKEYPDFQSAELDMAIDKAKQPGSIYDLNEGLADDFAKWAGEYVEERTVDGEGKILYWVEKSNSSAAFEALSLLFTLDPGLQSQFENVNTEFGEGDNNMTAFIFKPTFKDYIPVDEHAIKPRKEWSLNEMKQAIKHNIGWYSLDDIYDKKKVLEWFDANRRKIADFNKIRTRISENNEWCTDDEDHISAMLEGYSAIGAGPEAKANEDANHLDTLVNIQPGKYGKGTKEYDALMYYRENDPYKLTSLNTTKTNIKGISYNEPNDEWNINESKTFDENDGLNVVISFKSSKPLDKSYGGDHFDLKDIGSSGDGYTAVLSSCWTGFDYDGQELIDAITNELNQEEWGSDISDISIKRNINEDLMPDGKDKSLYVSEQDAINKLGAAQIDVDDNGQPIYKIGDTPYIVVDGILYTISDFGGYNEPNYPVRKTVFKQLN